MQFINTRLLLVPETNILACFFGMVFIVSWMERQCNVNRRLLEDKWSLLRMHYLRRVYAICIFNGYQCSVNNSLLKPHCLWMHVLDFYGSLSGEMPEYIGPEQLSAKTLFSLNIYGMCLASMEACQWKCRNIPFLNSSYLQMINYYGNCVIFFLYLCIILIFIICQSLEITQWP